MKMLFPRNIKFTSTLCLLWLGLIFMIGLPTHAHADCTSPAGKPGEVIFNLDHKVLQYCADTKWMAIGGGGSPPITDGNKGAITVTDNGQTWVVNYPGCPSGWTAQSGRGFCYSPVQAATYPHDAEFNCARHHGARVCGVGEYYLIETGQVNRWAQGLCGGTEGMQVTVGTGWGCAYWQTPRQYRCCKANPSTPIP